MTEAHEIAAIIYSLAALGAVAMALAAERWRPCKGLLPYTLAAVACLAQALDMHSAFRGEIDVRLACFFALMAVGLLVAWGYGRKLACDSSARLAGIAVSVVLLLTVRLGSSLPGTEDWHLASLATTLVSGIPFAAISGLVLCMVVRWYADRVWLARAACISGLALVIAGVGCLEPFGVCLWWDGYIGVGVLRFPCAETSLLLMATGVALLVEPAICRRREALAFALAWALCMAFVGEALLVVLFLLALGVLLAFLAKGIGAWRWGFAAAAAVMLACLIVAEDGYLSRMVAFIDPSADPYGMGWANFFALPGAHEAGGALGIGYAWENVLDLDQTWAYSNVTPLAGAVVSGGLCSFAVTVAASALFVKDSVAIAAEAGRKGIPGSHAALAAVALLALQAVLAIGMEAGLLPITSTPLPFSGWLALDFACLGIIMAPLGHAGRQCPEAIAPNRDLEAEDRGE